MQLPGLGTRVSGPLKSTSLLQDELQRNRYTIFVVEAPDDETVAKACMALASQGNLSTETLRAFTEDEFGRMIADLIGSEY